MQQGISKTLAPDARTFRCGPCFHYFPINTSHFSFGFLCEPTPTGLYRIFPGFFFPKEHSGIRWSIRCVTSVLCRRSSVTSRFDFFLLERRGQQTDRRDRARPRTTERTRTTRRGNHKASLPPSTDFSLQNKSRGLLLSLSFFATTYSFCYRQKCK